MTKPDLRALIADAAKHAYAQADAMLAVRLHAK